jgi:hypothetical protein
MNKDTRFTYSEEFLNSFVDNQLSAEEKSQAYLDIGQDQDLNRQVCELRKMHDLVQLAYQNVPPPPVAAGARPKHRRGMGVAASVLLVLGVALGMQLRFDTVVTPPSAATNPALVAQNNAPLQIAAPARAARVTASAPVIRPADASAAEPAGLLLANSNIPPRTPIPAHGVKNKVLIHLTDDTSSQLATALDEIEGLMLHYRDTRQTAHVEVVMNGRGLDLVRADTTTFAARVAQLQHEFHNLTFAACQNTIDRLKREQNITVRLLPGVIIIDSGMAEIMRRQHQGWTYLQV